MWGPCVTKHTCYWYSNYCHAINIKSGHLKGRIRDTGKTVAPNILSWVWQESQGQWHVKATLCNATCYRLAGLGGRLSHLLISTRYLGRYMDKGIIEISGIIQQVCLVSEHGIQPREYLWVELQMDARKVPSGSVTNIGYRSWVWTQEHSFCWILEIYCHWI
jgi:hypothetical protein